MDPIVAQVMLRLNDDYNPNRDPASGQFTSGPGGGGSRSKGLDRSGIGQNDRSDLARIRRSATMSDGGDTGGRIGRALGLALAAGGAVALGIAHPKAMGAVAIKKLGTAGGIGQLALTGLAGAQVGEILGAVLGDAFSALRPKANESKPILDLLPLVRALLVDDEEAAVAALEEFQSKYGTDPKIADRLSAALKELSDEELHTNYNEDHDDRGRFYDADGVPSRGVGRTIGGALAATAGGIVGNVGGAVAGGLLAQAGTAVALGALALASKGVSVTNWKALAGASLLIPAVATGTMKKADDIGALLGAIGGTYYGAKAGWSATAPKSNAAKQGVVKDIEPIMLAIARGDPEALVKAAQTFAMKYRSDAGIEAVLERAFGQIPDTPKTNYNKDHDELGRFTGDGAGAAIARGLATAGAGVAGAYGGAILGGHLAVAAATTALGVLSALRPGIGARAASAFRSSAAAGLGSYRHLGSVASAVMADTNLRLLLSRVTMGGAAVGAFAGGAAAGSYASHKLNDNTSADVVNALRPLMVALAAGDSAAADKAASNFKRRYGQNEAVVKTLARYVSANLPA